MRRLVFVCMLLIAVMTALSANAVPENYTSGVNSEVRFGERPFIDIYKVPDTAMEKGHIRIKLSEKYSQLAADLSYTQGVVSNFGITELDELNEQYGVTTIAKLFYSPSLNNKYTWRHQQWGLHLWFELRFTEKQDLRDMVMAYRDLTESVQWAEPEYKKTLLSVDNGLASLNETLSRWTPNDPQYGSQWHYNNTGQTGGTADADIDLPAAWDIEKGHPAVIVDIQDGGIQTDHPDLNGNLWNNPGEIAGNGIDDDANGYVDDIYGYNFVNGNSTIVGHFHGTHVSGTIAAESNNGIGVSGIAGGNNTTQGVRLMSTQVFTDSGNGGFETAPIYGADNGAAISQNSWGYTSAGYYDQPVLDAIDYFNANGGGIVMNGGITIYAAGNGSSSGQWYPGCYSGAFAVAATNHNDAKAWYSNYDTWVDVSAPGGETNTVTTQGVLSTYTGSGYNYLQGTSMACPHTSGVAALVLSYSYRNGRILTNTELADIIRNSTDNHYGANPSYIGQLGTGRINAYSALLAADPTLPSCTITAPTNGAVFNLNSTVAITATATDTDGTITSVAFYIDNVLQYTDPTSPYAWSWNTTGYSGGQHEIKVIATDNNSNTAVRTVNVTLLAPADEGFESGGFGAFPWNNTSPIPWTVQTTEKFSGIYAAKSGTITHSQSTTLSLPLTVSGAGNISFFFKLSSESSYDYLRFYIDGVQQGQWSGTVSWTQQTYPVTSGNRTFTWTYSKDGSVNTGSDCAWLDHINFPSMGTYYAPPQNLTALPSHQYVKLDWQAPATGTPTGYKIFKNSVLLTTVTNLTYTDTAVTNGTTYSYYLKAVYSGGNESDPTATVNATPNMVPPTNLTALAGNGFVNLTWTGATGREAIQGGANDERTISGYRVYRNGSPLTTVTATNYNDTNVVNETTYSYYVTTVYVSPAGESVASNTVMAMPTAVVPTTVIIGTGTLFTGTLEGCPINIWYKSLHGQSVYTQAELNAAGVFGPVNITQVGFYINSLPTLALPNFVVRMKHTADGDVTNWQTATNMVTVYTNAAYMPVAGGYEMLTLNAPFLWNGIDNIVIDTAFGLVANYSQTGTVQFSTLTNGYRYARDDYADQTAVYTGGSVITSRPNVKFTLVPNANGPMIMVNPTALNYGDVVVGANSVRQITIQNTGNETLNGTITTPVAYVVSQARAEGARSVLNNRNTIEFSVEAGQNKIYSVTFTPATAIAYNGNITISSDAINNTNLIIPVTGTGYVPPTVVVTPQTLSASLAPDQTTVDYFTISNNGSQALNYSIWLEESLYLAQAGRNITGSTLNVDALNYTPGMTQDWTFTVYNASTDAEWLKDIFVTFPAGVIVNSATNFVGGSGGDMIPAPSSGNGITINWHGESSGWGVIYGGETATATVNVTVTPSFSGLLSLPFQIDGDIYGTEPHILYGTMTIAQDIPAVDWLSAQPLSGSITGGQNQVVTVNFSSLGKAPGVYEAIIYIDSNDPTMPQIPVFVTMTVSGNLTAPNVTITKTLEGIRVSWDAVPNATRYHIYHSTNPHSGYISVGTTTQLFYQTTVPLTYEFFYVKAERD